MLPFTAGAPAVRDDNLSRGCPVGERTCILMQDLRIYGAEAVFLIGYFSMTCITLISTVCRFESEPGGDFSGMRLAWKK
jgi:hypothetical protein